MNVQVRGQALEPESRGRRIVEHPAEAAPDGLPPEIGFLAAYGVPQAVLRRAASVAASSGVTADCALLNEGTLSATQFYELLAHHLGVAFLHHPLPVAPGIAIEQAMVAQIVPLAANPTGVDFALAPRGEALAMLLRRFAGNPPGGGRRVAITSPQRLAALVRLHHRPSIVRDASHGLPPPKPCASSSRRCS
jgi:hypothetical protein